MWLQDNFQQAMAVNANLPLLGAYALAGFGLVLSVTYVSSWLQSFPAKPHTGHEPPVVPYYLPYLGHIFTFLQNPGKLLQRLRYTSVVSI